MSLSQQHAICDVKTAPIKFLIVDDDEVSVMAIKRALKKLKIVNELQVAKDGQEALNILRGDCGAYKLSPPYLVTLDLNSIRPVRTRVERFPASSSRA